MLSPKQGSLAGERAIQPEDAVSAGAAWLAGPGAARLGAQRCQIQC